MEDRGEMLGWYKLNEIYLCDAKGAVHGIPNNSVDLIFTDPIYQNIEDYAWLAKTAARILQPGKSCLALAGNMEKPQIYDVMRPHLDYHWEGCILYRGANFFMNSRAIQVSWKPVLWFTKGKRETRWCKDALVDSGADKTYGRWQQSPAPAIWFIRQLTSVGDVVLDPFAGWGTYPMACKLLGRRWLAFDINAERIAAARQRVEELCPLPLGFEASNQLNFLSTVTE